MSPVDHSVQVRPAPPWRDVQPHLERSKHLSHCPERHVLQDAALQAADDRAADAGRFRHGRLSQVLADAYGPARSPDLGVIHVPILATGPYRSVTRFGGRGADPGGRAIRGSWTYVLAGDRWPPQAGLRQSPGCGLTLGRDRQRPSATRLDWRMVAGPLFGPGSRSRWVAFPDDTGYAVGRCGRDQRGRVSSAGHATGVPERVGGSHSTCPR